jgi:hypothetical protein
MINDGENADYLSSVIKTPAAGFVKYKCRALILIVVYFTAL